jgi:predicted aspartyl protease
MVAATVEGQPANLLLDTGSERSCLDAGFAARLQFHSTGAESIRQPYGTRAVDGIRIRDLGLDSFHVRDLEMLSGDLSSMSLAIGVPIDGVLGSDVLRHFTVTIDFSSGSAQFAANATMPTGEDFVRLHPVGNLYFVPLSIQGTSVSLLLDTGTNASSVSTQAWANVTTHWRPQSMVDGVRSSGGSESAKFVLIPTIGLGSVTSRNIPLRVQPQTQDGLFADARFDGLLGTDVLRQFIVTLDLNNDKMYLKSDPHSRVDLDRFSTIGIQFAKDAEGSFTIMAVWDPSPATVAGLKIGDRILAVNQMDTHSMSLDDFSLQIHGRPGKAVHLTVDSDGNRHDASMAISCLLCPTHATGEERK